MLDVLLLFREKVIGDRVESVAAELVVTEDNLQLHYLSVECLIPNSSRLEKRK